MGRGDWWVTGQRVAKESDTAENSDSRSPSWGPRSPFKRENSRFPTSDLTYIHLHTGRGSVRPSLPWAAERLVALAVHSLSRVWLLGSPLAVPLLSMGFPRHESWSGLPWPSPVGLPNPGTEPTPLCLLHCRTMLYHWATEEAHRPP